MAVGDFMPVDGLRVPFRMPTMPAMPDHGQPDDRPAQASASAWFATPPGLAMLDSEAELILHALAERPAQPGCGSTPLCPRSGLGSRQDAACAWRRTARLGRGRSAAACRCRSPASPSAASCCSTWSAAARPSAAAAGGMRADPRRRAGGCGCSALNPWSSVPLRVGARSGLHAREPRHAGGGACATAGLSRRRCRSGSARAGGSHGDASTQDGRRPARRLTPLRAEKRTIPLTPLRGRALRLEAVSPA